MRQGLKGAKIGARPVTYFLNNHLIQASKSYEERVHYKSTSKGQVIATPLIDVALQTNDIGNMDVLIRLNAKNKSRVIKTICYSSMGEGD